jgi:hypothetical protein
MISLQNSLTISTIPLDSLANLESDILQCWGSVQTPSFWN